MSKRGYTAMEVGFGCAAALTYASSVLAPYYTLLCIYPPFFVQFDSTLGVGYQLRDGWPTIFGARLLLTPTEQFPSRWPALPYAFQFSGSGSFIAGVPMWMLGILFLLSSFYCHRKGRRPKLGHCRKCDYDLTGNESGTCPECGTRT